MLFVDAQDAVRASQALNGTQLSNRTIKCSIAIDNGRAREFIKKKVYNDKSRCYECGVCVHSSLVDTVQEEGHLSYKCPRNIFGERKRPTKVKAKKRKKRTEESEEEEEEEPNSEDFDDYRVIRYSCPVGNQP